MRLTAAERRNLPDSAFALPELRKFPIHDPGHIKAGAARIAQALHEGRITETEYDRAESRVLAAERRFGMHSYASAAATTFDASPGAFVPESYTDTVKLGVIGSVLAGTALLAWYCRPNKTTQAKTASGWLQPAAQTGARFVQSWPGEPIPPMPQTHVDEWPVDRVSKGPSYGLRTLAASLTPQQKAVVHAARAAGKSPVEALRAAGVSPELLAAAAR